MSRPMDTNYHSTNYHNTNYHSTDTSTGSTEKYKEKFRKILIFETSSLFSHVENRDIIK